jgi:hypothetical protein
MPEKKKPPACTSDACVGILGDAPTRHAATTGHSAKSPAGLRGRNHVSTEETMATAQPMLLRLKKLLADT